MKYIKLVACGAIVALLTQSCGSSGEQQDEEPFPLAVVDASSVLRDYHAFADEFATADSLDDSALLRGTNLLFDIADQLSKAIDAGASAQADTLAQAAGALRAIIYPSIEKSAHDYVMENYSLKHSRMLGTPNGKAVSQAMLTGRLTPNQTPADSTASSTQSAPRQ